MRLLSLLLSAAVRLAPLGVGAAAVPGCAINLPEKVVLTAEAANVEIVTEPPNRDVYESAGEVTAQVIGRETEDALRQGLNQLRNQAATKHASFVAVNDVTSRAAWDFSGRTVVSVVGTAYRPK